MHVACFFDIVLKLLQAVIHSGPHRRFSATLQLPIACSTESFSAVLVTASRNNFYASRFNYVRKSSRRFNVVHFPCHHITCVKFNNKLTHNAFYLLINARNISALTVGHFQGTRKVSACAPYTSTYVIKITIMKIKCFNSYNHFCS